MQGGHNGPQRLIPWLRRIAFESLADLPRKVRRDLHIVLAECGY
jgi:hypothetical protein